MKATIFFLCLCVCFPAFAQRDPVLKQIDVPHPYYYREMYLPQLTSGPSAASWSPDSKSVVYSMAGSLWIQPVDSGIARQITAGPGYDYQPDWSPDGKQIVFSRYNNDAVELLLLDVASNRAQQLTNGGAVNVDARWSPDGKNIAFVSTSYNKKFHIFLAELQDGNAPKIQQLTEERKSTVSRYYYSSFDHELSPTWSPDGSEIIFISNRGNIYGSGGFWRMKVQPGSQAREIRYEETTWKAHPDWSPDGARVIYSSYLGRQWHQLWIMTSEGGDPFPLTYGEFDITMPRWSPDGKQIAFISNQGGNTSLYIQDVIGGAQRELKVTERKYMVPMGTLRLTVLDPSNQPTAARISITGADGRTYAPYDAWIHGDDAFVRSERSFEPYYFHTKGTSEIVAPEGKITVEVMKGFEYALAKVDTQLSKDPQELTVRLAQLPLPENWNQWISGDLHVHMNYGGAYRNTPEYLMIQAAAENLPVIYNLVVNKEQRIPDIEYYNPKADSISNSNQLLVHSQEFHTSYWGHMGLLNLKRNYLIPDYSTYANTGAASPYPTNAVIADLAHAQGALVGYVHPFDTVPDPSDKNTRLVHELPADAALGKVDYLEVVGFSDHRATAEVWYRLLNSGLRVAAGAGTDAMANFASLRGPVGTNRVYVKHPAPLDADGWNENLRKGHSFVTNGPLIWFSIDGKGPGEDLEFSNQASVKFQATLRSIIPVDHFEIVSNGKVVKAFELQGDRMSGDFSGTIPVSESGWYVLRAWNDKPTYPILDIYPYATTNPVFLTIGGKPVRIQKDRDYFAAWIDRIIEATQSNEDYYSKEEKQAVLDMLNAARKKYE
jgi:Tol biopolymer transport system component